MLNFYRQLDLEVSMGGVYRVEKERRKNGGSGGVA